MKKPPVILLGVTGGIAAFKAAALTSLLTRAGMDVRVVMTKNAAELVSPRTFQALSKNPVYTDMFSDDSSAHPHIDLARQCSLMCVAPATANFLGKAANGIADDLLSTTVLAFNGPIILAPAMNETMWSKPAVKRNVKTLAKDGFLFVGPETGRLSCGESGVGRMAEPEQILQKIQDVLSCIKS
ncbi:MAG: phosphopantothenoylcysteine decarboxylase [Thermoguttaceae bacterium]|nr:phosphopantothenoylcysteine decarboxylase [Thermoguttaceae bacterium]MBR6436165.1 phosphopantothenoylcysteine decarboxylase [Thermoguttaceae bacterium]